VRLELGWGVLAMPRRFSKCTDCILGCYRHLSALLGEGIGAPFEYFHLKGKPELGTSSPTIVADKNECWFTNGEPKQHFRSSTSTSLNSVKQADFIS
jgi:hypothetical protein